MIWITEAETVAEDTRLCIIYCVKFILTPPAEWQRSFSNADLSVVCMASTFHLTA